jgi:hypothetical protein
MPVFLALLMLLGPLGLAIPSGHNVEINTQKEDWSDSDNDLTVSQQQALEDIPETGHVGDRTTGRIESPSNWGLERNISKLWTIEDVSSEYWITELAFSPDDSFLITGTKIPMISHSVYIGIWRTSPWSETISTELADFEFEEDIESVALSADGSFLAIGTYANITIWDSSRNGFSFITSLESSGYIETLVFSPDGAFLASERTGTGAEGSVVIWDTSDWSEQILDEQVHYVPIDKVEFSPDGSLLASCSENEILIWDTSDWTVKETLTREQRFACTQTFSPSGAQLVDTTSFYDEELEDYIGALVIWDTSSWNEQIISIDSYFLSTDLAFSPDGGSLVVSTFLGVGIFDTSDWTHNQWLSCGFLCNPIAVSSIAFSHDGSMIALGGNYGTMIFSEDSDSDGIADVSDQCPGGDDGIDQDEDGIPDACDDSIDSDGDGVVDPSDLCPSSPTGEAVNSNGCTMIEYYMPTLYFDNRECYFPINRHRDDDDVSNNMNNYRDSKANLQCDGVHRWTSSPSPTVYYEVKEYDDHFVYEYWFYYVYSEFKAAPLSAIRDASLHEHDYEWAFVWVDKESLQPSYLALSQHNWVNEYTISSRDELKVNVEWGGHGMIQSPVSPASYAKGDGEYLSSADFKFKAMDSSPADLTSDGFFRDTDGLPACRMIPECKAPWLQPQYKDPDTIINYGEEGFNLDDLKEIAFRFAVVVKLFSPAELYLEDSQGRVTGLVDGVVREEIPLSWYDEEQEMVVVLGAEEELQYFVKGRSSGTYGLSISYGDDASMSNFNANDIPTHGGIAHQYNVNWAALEAGDSGVELKVDANGDGRFESMLISDSSLNQDEFTNDLVSVSGSSDGSGGGSTLLLFFYVLIPLLVIGLGVGYVVVYKKEELITLFQPNVIDGDVNYSSFDVKSDTVEEE